MKKVYTEPLVEFIYYKLTVDVLIHSDFENGGKNDSWDWNDDDDDLTPGQRFYGDQDGLY